MVLLTGDAGVGKTRLVAVSPGRSLATLSCASWWSMVRLNKINEAAESTWCIRMPSSS
jgi:hypothetical protein